MMQAICVGFSANSRLTAVQIVELRNERILHRVGGNASAGGHLVWSIGIAIELSLGLHADHHRVVHAVVGAFHLDDLVATSEAARQPDGMHRDFGAAAAKACLIDREPLADLLGQLVFEGVRHAIHRADFKTFLHCSHNGGMTVTRHQRAEAKVEVDVFVSVEIVDVRALGVFDEERPRFVAAEVAGYAERQARFSLLECGARRGSARFKDREFFFEKGMHQSSPLPRRVRTVPGRSIDQQGRSDVILKLPTRWPIACRLETRSCGHRSDSLRA